MNAAQYIIDAGWDWTAIEATAKMGVADEDIERLSDPEIREAYDGLTPDDLLRYCRDRVREYA